MTGQRLLSWPPHGLVPAGDGGRLGSVNIPVVLRVLGRRHRLRQRDRWTREQLQAHQAHALRQLRDHAYAHSPFYQRVPGPHPGGPAAPIVQGIPGSVRQPAGTEQARRVALDS